MISPDQLLRHADILFNQRSGYRSGSGLGIFLRVEADFSRAISSAYYAVFHACLHEAAIHIVGTDNLSSPLYTLVYRSIDHKQLRDICVESGKTNPKPMYQKYIPSDGLGSDIRGYANTFVELYELRMLADYDPTVTFTMTEVGTSIKAARTAIERLGRANAEMKRIFLTLLLFRPR